MDPNAALANLRDAVARVKDDDDSHAKWDVAEAFDALDEWLTRGGFLPEEWAR